MSLVLQVLADHHLLDGKVVPSRFLSPVVSHCLFVLGCEGVDLGVQRGSERVLCCLADRALQVASDPSHDADDRQSLFHLTFSLTLPALRRMLRAPTEDVFRTALRTQAHYIRTLACHCEKLQWKQKGRDEAANFGSSPEAMLHADLLPLLRAKDAKGDEGGDLFANLLHLQKHRRGRGLAALCRTAEAGKLTQATLTHFAVPLSTQAVLQYGASSAAFDPNYAETGVKCLAECMRGVTWMTCLHTVRHLALLLSKQEARERWIVRAACECLQRFPFPEREIPGPDLLEGFGGPDVPEKLTAAVEPQVLKKKSKGKGKGRGKGKGPRKGRGKGKRPKEKSGSAVQGEEGDDAEETLEAAAEEPQDVEMPDTKGTTAFRRIRAELRRAFTQDMAADPPSEEGERTLPVLTASAAVEEGEADLDDSFIEAMVASEDQDALQVQAFEEELENFFQDTPELQEALVSYLEARSRLLAKKKSRGFWPVGGGKGASKGGRGFKGNGKGKGKHREQLLARIARSNC
eukprot:s897_g1.t1